MVVPEKPLILLVGEDALSKETKLKALKEKFLAKDLEQFNLDILYARELLLKTLQEHLLNLPVKSKKRLIIIKEAQNLKKEIKDFLFGLIKKMPAHLCLILDFSRGDERDQFLRNIKPFAQTYSFRDSFKLNAFTLSRHIESKKPVYALRVLAELLKNGERPEMILGALRHAWERDDYSFSLKRKRFQLLLDCDLEIKTGRLKAQLALEKLIISLCAFSKT